MSNVLLSNQDGMPTLSAGGKEIFQLTKKDLHPNSWYRYPEIRNPALLGLVQNYAIVWLIQVSGYSIYSAIESVLKELYS